MIADFKMPYEKIVNAIAISAVIAIIGAMSYFYVHSLKSEIARLKQEAKEYQVEVANYKLESIRNKSFVKSQNRKIEKWKRKSNLAEIKLEKWKNQKPEVKYKYISKIREVKSNDCKDIKNTLNAVRDINISELY